MLRITEKKRTGSSLICAVEGTIDPDGLDEVYAVCTGALAEGLEPVLDLSGVLFVTRAAVVRFRALSELPVDMVNCSPFLAEQLKLDGCNA